MTHLEKRGSISILRLEHGKVAALDAELLTTLVDCLDEVEASTTPALVLTGTGSSFSAGVDLWRVLDGGEAYLREFLPTLTRALSRLFLFPRPVIAAVNGHAIAGGCVLTCCCDYRLMADGPARIGVSELRVGVPFPSLPLEIMRFAASNSHLQELVYLGETYAPAEAKERGLIDEIVPADQLLKRARQVAERLAAIPAQSFEITKRQLRQPVLDRVAGHGREVEDAVARAWTDREVHAAIRAYMEATIGKRN